MEANVQFIGGNGATGHDLDNVLRAKPALVCDLDGTLRYNPDGEFIHEPDDIEFYDGVIEALWAYREDGFLIFVVTNQGGVAHGHLTPQDFDRQMTRMQEMAKEIDSRGLPFHMTQRCFFMADGTRKRWAFRSLRRKPSYGALAVLENQARMNNVIVDWDASYVIGDREEDRHMAKRADITFVWAGTWRRQIYEQLIGGDGDE